MSKNHAHNQRTKIKLNVIVFMLREKKDLLFLQRERILWRELLSHTKFLGPKKTKNFGEIPLGN